MIIGTGIDIENIDRFSAITEKKSLFKKCFTEYEQAYITARKKYAQTAAGIFCAKEAFFKALKTGIAKYPLRDAEVRHDDMGAPYFVFYGELKKDMKGRNVFLSISHNSAAAVAQAVIEESEGGY